MHLNTAAMPPLPEELAECPADCCWHSEPEQTFSAQTWTRRHIVATRLPGVVLDVRDYWGPPGPPRRTVDIDIAGYAISSGELAELADFAMFRELGHLATHLAGNHVAGQAPGQLALDESQPHLPFTQFQESPAADRHGSSHRSLTGEVMHTNPHAVYQRTKSGQEVFIAWATIDDDGGARYGEPPGIALCFEDVEEPEQVYRLSLDAARNLARMITEIVDQAKEEADDPTQMVTGVG
jgi:hypothetical protein